MLLLLFDSSFVVFFIDICAVAPVCLAHPIRLPHWLLQMELRVLRQD